MLAVVIIAGLAVGGYFGKKRYDAYIAQLNACRDERAQLAAKNGDRDAELLRIAEERDHEKSVRTDSEKLVADAQADLSATRAELEELRRQRAESEQRLAAVKQITTKLQKMIDTGKLKVLLRGGRMIVKLPAEVLFPSGRAELSPSGEAALAEVAGALREFQNRKFMVAGHTDNLPVSDNKYKNNWDLSTERALNVTEFLIKSGMRPQSLVAAGYAEFDPAASNGTAAGRQENRRIEIGLLPNIDELPRLLDKTMAAASATPSAGAPIPASAPIPK
jgi:chemotaxis protein MotB